MSVKSQPKSLQTCTRCHGTGRIPEYAHIADGRCYRCDGEGKLSALKNEILGFPNGRALLETAREYGTVHLFEGLDPELTGRPFLKFLSVDKRIYCWLSGGRVFVPCVTDVVDTSAA